MISYCTAVSKGVGRPSGVRLTQTSEAHVSLISIGQHWTVLVLYAGDPVSISSLWVSVLSFFFNLLNLRYWNTFLQLIKFFIGINTILWVKYLKEIGFVWEIYATVSVHLGNQDKWSNYDFQYGVMFILHLRIMIYALFKLGNQIQYNILVRLSVSFSIKIHTVYRILENRIKLIGQIKKLIN